MKNGPISLVKRLEDLVAPEVKKLGYDLLDIEYQTQSAQGGPLLRLFIESPTGKGISYEDCVAVDHGLDPLFESPSFDEVLSAGFTLEVSSPGLDRPLKNPSDFLRFTGKKAQIRTFRPLTVAEMGNEKYFVHHQKQKNFIGTLLGYVGDSVELETDNERFKIPYALITKANLDVESQLSAAEQEELTEKRKA